MPGEADYKDGQHFQSQPRDRNSMPEFVSRAPMQNPNDPDEHQRSATQNQMQQQNSFEFLPFELELPREQPRSNYGNRGNGRAKQIVVSRHCEGVFLGDLRQKVKDHSGNEQCDWKMDQHDM